MSGASSLSPEGKGRDDKCARPQYDNDKTSIVSGPQGSRFVLFPGAQQPPDFRRPYTTQNVDQLSTAMDNFGLVYDRPSNSHVRYATHDVNQPNTTMGSFELVHNHPWQWHGPSASHLSLPTQTGTEYHPSANVLPGQQQNMLSLRDAELYKTFKKRPTPKKFFKVGKVFSILWTEPLGDDNGSIYAFAGTYGERFFSKVRRFIVIRQSELYCSAVPILTYGHKGIGKTRHPKSDHAIIYSGRQPPIPRPEEQPGPGEMPMHPHPIRVDIDDPTDTLRPESRIDYGKIYTIEYNAKVKSVGMVHRDSLPLFMRQLSTVWGGIWWNSQTQVGSPGPVPGDSTSTAYAPSLPSGSTAKTADEVLPRVPAAGETVSSGNKEGGNHDDDVTPVGRISPQQNLRSRAALSADRENALSMHQAFQKLLSTVPPHTPERALEALVAAAQAQNSLLDQQSAETLIRNQLQYARSLDSGSVSVT